MAVDLSAPWFLLPHAHCQAFSHPAFDAIARKERKREGDKTKKTNHEGHKEILERRDPVNGSVAFTVLFVSFVLFASFVLFRLRPVA
jgi:hypothetical protein